MAEVQQNSTNELSQQSLDISKLSTDELVKNILKDSKLDWNDLESYKALLESLNKEKSEIVSDTTKHNIDLFSAVSKEVLTKKWFEIKNNRDKEVLKMLLDTYYSNDLQQSGENVVKKSFQNLDFSKLTNWLYKLSEDNRYLSIYFKNPRNNTYVEHSRFDAIDWSYDLIFSSDETEKTDNNSISTNGFSFDAEENLNWDYDQSVQNIVTWKEQTQEKTNQSSSEQLTPEQSSAKVEENQSSSEQSSPKVENTKPKENSKINFSKAIDENNKKFPTDELKKEIFDKLGITWTLEFSEEVIQKIADFQTSKWLKVDWAIWSQTLHALWIENKTEKKSKKKLKHKDSHNTESKSKKEKHISNINLIEEINKLSTQDLLMKYNTDAEFKLNIINSKDNFKAFYQKTHNVESTSKIDANWLPIEPKETNLIAWESVNNLSSESQIIQFLNKEGFNAKPIEWKAWTYELDLVWLFDDSILKINPDLSMNFSTSKYEIDGKPKEFRVANIDELKTILKDINDLTIAKTNLNRLNDKNNPDNQFFHADKIKTYQDQVDAIKRYLDAK